MQLDTTTLVLEIINFLVLLWLLKRFLFAPFRQAMLERQAKVQTERDALAKQKADLSAAQAQLTAEREQLASAKTQAQQQLTAELEQERQRRLAQLERELTDSQQQQRARLAAQLGQQQRQQAQVAKNLAVEFVSEYLQRLQGAELEAAIIRLFSQDLAQLPEAERQPLRQTSLGQVHIATAYPPSESTRLGVEAAFNQLLEQSPSYHWQQQPELLAGISVALDGHLLEASLARGLNAFVQQKDETGDKSP